MRRQQAAMPLEVLLAEGRWPDIFSSGRGIQDLTSHLQNSLELGIGTQKGQVWSILYIFTPRFAKPKLVWVAPGIWWELRHAWELRERVEWG